MQKHNGSADTLKAGIGIVLLVVAPTATALQPLITDDTGTLGKAGSQIEFSYNQDRAEAVGTTTRTRTLPAVFTHGLTDTLDAFAQANHTSIRTTDPANTVSGSGNPSFGIKWRAYENDQFSLGFKPEIVLPVSADKESAGLGAGRTSYGATVILTREFATSALHVNLGVSRDRFRDTTATPDATTGSASIASVWNVSEDWKLALDLGTETNMAGGRRLRTGFVEFGAIYSPHPQLELALGAIRSKDNDTPRTTTTSATLGITWRFE